MLSAGDCGLEYASRPAPERNPGTPSRGFGAHGSLLAFALTVLIFALCPPLVFAYTCSAGAYLSGTSCFPCVTQYFCPGDDKYYLCPAGSYGGGPSMSSCTPCPPFTYSWVTGASSSTVCSPCGAGRFSGAGAANCLPCANGTYGTGSSACLPCSPGSSTDGQVGLANCIGCAVGKFASASGSGACDLCSPGNATASTFSRACLTRCRGLPYSFSASGAGLCCQAGYSSFSSTTCTPCPAGAYSLITSNETASMTQCLQCPAGTASAVVGASSTSACKLCDAGSFTYGSGSTSCLQCGPGWFSPSVGGTSCFQCPAGKYQLYAGQVSCQTCAGDTGSNAGQNMCCPLGYVYTYGSCAICPLGSYANITTAKRCEVCPGGTSATVTGAKSLSGGCRSCPAGTYNPVGSIGYTTYSSPNVYRCPLCPAGRWSTGNATSCTPCPEGTYSNTRGGIGLASCIPCSTLSCTSGASAMCALGSMSKISSAYCGAQHGCSSCVGSTKDSCDEVFGGCGPSYYQGCSETYGCVACGQGTYAVQTGARNSSKCLLCPAGTSSLASGATSNATCVPCPAGFSSGPGSGSCEPCPIGTASSVVGSTSTSICYICKPGSFGRYTFMNSGTQYTVGDPSRCQLCTAGRWVNGTSTYVTSPTYDASIGYSICQACPAGLYSAPGAGVCCSLGSTSFGTDKCTP